MWGSISESRTNRAVTGQTFVDQPSYLPKAAGTDMSSAPLRGLNSAQNTTTRKNLTWGMVTQLSRKNKACQLVFGRAAKWGKFSFSWDLRGAASRERKETRQITENTQGQRDALRADLFRPGQAHTGRPHSSFQGGRREESNTQGTPGFLRPDFLASERGWTRWPWDSKAHGEPLKGACFPAAPPPHASRHVRPGLPKTAVCQREIHQRVYWAPAFPSPPPRTAGAGQKRPPAPNALLENGASCRLKSVPFACFPLSTGGRNTHTLCPGRGGSVLFINPQLGQELPGVESARAVRTRAPWRKEHIPRVELSAEAVRVGCLLRHLGQPRAQRQKGGSTSASPAIAALLPPNEPPPLPSA